MKKLFVILTGILCLSVIVLIVYPSFRYTSINKETVIAIQPFGDFSSEDSEITQKNIEDFYKC